MNKLILLFSGSFLSTSILIFLLQGLVSCNHRFEYLTKQDKEIIVLIQSIQPTKLLEHFNEQVEFDYGSEGSIIFLKSSDSENLTKSTDSEVYNFLFKEKLEIPEKNTWISLRDSLNSAYKIEGENNEVNQDSSYFRSIHIYNEKSYNRINLKCREDGDCKIYYFLMSGARI
ncbi:MAG: hypothetical protein KDK54_12200 [Leptospiraceae bacterium]|nr:hypothetical protein [Leptospiraceae bacterium]